VCLVGYLKRRILNALYTGSSIWWGWGVGGGNAYPNVALQSAPQLLCVPSIHGSNIGHKFGHIKDIHGFPHPLDINPGCYPSSTN